MELLKRKNPEKYKVMYDLWVNELKNTISNIKV